LQRYSAEAQSYKLAIDAALQKFTVSAEVKKLGSALYGQELSNSLASYQTAIDIPKFKIDLAYKQAALRTGRDIDQAKLTLDRLALTEKASEAEVSAYQNMASATLGALNTVTSSSIAASA
jgi:hypothetical protein